MKRTNRPGYSKEVIYQRNKTRKASREPFEIRRSNWIYQGNDAPPICSIHNEVAVWHKNRARPPKYGQWACKTCARNKSKGLKRKWKTGHTNPKEYNLKKQYTLAKHHSKKIGREFTIDFDEVLQMWDSQNGKCNICKRHLEYIPGNNKRNPRKATIDRIDSRKGYIENNVHLLCEQCNRAKQDLSKEEMIRFAKGILDYFNAH
jgi:hypothetical protein